MVALRDPFGRPSGLLDCPFAKWPACFCLYFQVSSDRHPLRSMSKRVCRPGKASQRQAIPWFEFLRVARLTSISREGAVVPRQRCPGRLPIVARASYLPTVLSAAAGSAAVFDGQKSSRGWHTRTQSLCRRPLRTRSRRPHRMATLAPPAESCLALRSDGQIRKNLNLLRTGKTLRFPRQKASLSPPRRGFQLACHCANKKPGNLPGPIMKTFK